MNPHETIAAHQRTVEGAEAEDGPLVRTWSVYAGIAGSKYLGEVEAPTGAAAIEAAYGLGEASISLCHRCADQVQDPEVEHVTVVCGDEEATDRPDPDLRLHEIARARQALRLLELVENACASRGEITVYLAEGTRQIWQIGEASAFTLAEAVEAALEELGRE